MKILTAERVLGVSVKEAEMYSPTVDEIGIFRGEEAVGSDRISEITGRVGNVARKAAEVTWGVIKFANPFSLTTFLALSQPLALHPVPFVEHATGQERARREKIDIIRAGQFFRPE